jgi:hypothetical protein
MAAKLGDAKFGTQHLESNEKLTAAFLQFYILHFSLSAQTVSQRLQKAFQQFESDSH